MARRKQTRPGRSNAVQVIEGSESDEEDTATLALPYRRRKHPLSDDVLQESRPLPAQKKRARKGAFCESESKEIPWQSMVLSELSGKEVAEIQLLNTSATGDFCQSRVVSEHGVTRVRIQWRAEENTQMSKFLFKKVSRNNLKVQVVLDPKADGTSCFTGGKDQSDQISCNTEVLISGEIDGSDATVTALVYLIQLKYVSLKPAAYPTPGLSPGLRIILTNKAFNSPDSTAILMWKKSIQTIMCWLRPEIHFLSGMRKLSEEARAESQARGLDSKLHAFDPTALYDAVKPSRTEQCMEMNFPQLLPELRPYQRDAASWMVQRERGNGKTICAVPDTSGSKRGPSGSQQCTSTTKCGTWNANEHPLWHSVRPMDATADFYYHPLSGTVSVEPGDFVSYVQGGILADEMGLGKTVELLACILANPNKDLPSPSPAETAMKDLQDTLLKRKGNRIECLCGSTEVGDYQLGWIKCAVCDAWQHSTCVAYSNPTENFRAQMMKKITVSDHSGETEPDILSTGNKFVCRKCVESIGNVEVEGDSGATLVVCPTPILQQWQDEILRHTKPGSLRVIVYEGVGKGAITLSSPCERDTTGNRRLKQVSAYNLAAADIVLTTYDILRSDVFHDADKTKIVQRSMRYIKRFPVLPTPLTRLTWWRVCLDEAQMVENTTTKASEMALLLKAQNRWCVSGTPIQRGLDDLFGLFKFLQAKPFDNYRNWREVLQQPYEAGETWATEFLHEFLRLIMWRSSKKDVKDELNLPKQEDDVTYLEFLPLDAYIYQEKHDLCVQRAKDIIRKYRKQNEERSGTLDLKDADSPLLSSEASIFSSCFLQLRQACCHSQVGSAGIRNLQQSKPMTKDEIFQELLKRKRMDAEEHQRSLIAALNGLAGLAIIENDMMTAKSLYREALTLIEKNEAEISVDPLQKLHILHNLADIVGMPGTNDARTLRDDVLEKQRNDIRDKYIGAFSTKCEIEKEKYLQAHQQVAEAKDALEKAGGRYWWSEVLAMQCGAEGEELVNKIKDHFLDNANTKTGRVENASSLTHRFRNVVGLRYVLETELQAIQEKREKAVRSLKNLRTMMNNPTIEYAERHANCKTHTEQKGDECEHCQVERDFQEYENRLLLLRTLAGKADGIVSAEEAIIAQHRIATQRRIVGPEDESSNGNKFIYGASGRSARESNAVQSQVIWAPSETEVVLSLIKTKAKFKQRELRDAAQKHLQMFEALRKEYGYMRKWVSSQRLLLNSLDELNMATIRHRLQLSGEKPETHVEKRIIIHREEVPQRKMQLEVDRDVAKKDLSDVEARLRFLKGLSLERRRTEDTQAVSSGRSLQKSTDMKECDQDEEESCRICFQFFSSHGTALPTTQKFPLHRMVLPCGHLMCQNCCLQLISRTQKNSRTPTPAGKDTSVEDICIFCPQCRQKTFVGDIMRVEDKSDKTSTAMEGSQHAHESRDREEAEITVKGYYGTKIEPIVRRMKWVISEDPLAKVLVFSTWHEVLDVVEDAFKENGIRSVRVKGSNLNKALQEFRASPNATVPGSSIESSSSTDDGPIQALLMPFKQGGNGLNLIEAQHVILVEPLPNPGVEAQAINRVHRIGQSRPTFVHRFIIRNSVEERIYELSRQKTDIENLTQPRTKHHSSLTFSDVNALFARDIVDDGQSTASEDPHRIPPSAAAGAAAEARRSAILAPVTAQT